MVLTHLTEGVEYIDAAIVALRDLSVERDLTADETEAFEAGLAERAKLVAKIDTYNRASEIIANKPTLIVSGDGAQRTAPNVIIKDADVHTLDGIQYGDDDALRNRALRAIEAEGTMLDRHKEQTARLVRNMPTEVAARVLLTSSPEYGRAYLKMTSGREFLLSDSERAAFQRAVAISGTASYAVPAPIDTTIIDTAAHSTNPLRQLATKKQIAGTYWTGVSSAGVTASWDGEGVEVSDDAPTLGQPQIPTFKMNIFVPFSVESEDWQNLAADVRKMMFNAKEDLEAAAFVTGNGTSAPQGVTTALDGTGSEIAPATAETFAKGDIDRLVAALPSRFRRSGRASFLANYTWYNAIRAFETTVGVGSLISTNPVDYAGDFTVAGWPAYEASDMDSVLPNAAATADNFGLLFGDWAEAYYIVDRVGLNVELVPHLFHTSNNRPSGQRGYYAYARTGGEVVNTSAAVMLSIPTAA